MYDQIAGAYLEMMDLHGDRDKGGGEISGSLQDNLQQHAQNKRRANDQQQIIDRYAH